MLRVKNGRKYTRYQIVQIGAGGNGSNCLRAIVEYIITYFSNNRNINYFFDLTIVDADEVESKNEKNQLFFKEDVGEKKVDALAQRYGDTIGLDIKTVTEYITDTSLLKKLFSPLRADEEVQIIPILYGMVDNNATRHILHEFFYSDFLSDLIYIDAGIEDVAKEGQKENGTSGFNGQVVCGLKMNGEVILQPVGIVFPNILEDKSDRVPGASCGQTIVSNPQRRATNKMAGELSALYLNNLLHTGCIYSPAIMFNAQTGNSNAFPISKEIIEKFQNQIKGE